MSYQRELEAQHLGIQEELDKAWYWLADIGTPKADASLRIDTRDYEN